MPENTYTATLPAASRPARAPAWPEARTMIVRALRLSLRNVDALTTA